MNHLKVTSTVKQTMLALLKLKIPAILVAKLLDINLVTLQKHIPQEYKDDGEAFPEKMNERKLSLLYLYAELLADEVGVAAETGIHQIVGLKQLLPAYLRLDLWEQFLAGVISYKNAVECNTFSSDVSEGYRGLIEVLYPSYKIKLSAKEVLQKILIAMHREELPYPSTAEIGSARKALMPYVKKEMTGSRNTYFDTTFVSVLHGMLHKMDERQMVIVGAYFDLTDITTVKVGELSEKYQLTLQRIGFIKNKGLEKIARWLARDFGSLPDRTMADYVGMTIAASVVYEKLKKIESATAFEFNTLTRNVMILANYIQADNKDGLKKDAMEIIGKLLPSSLDERANKNFELYKKLQIPLEDLELSVRAFNCVKAAQINSLADLVLYTQEELLKFRNFGQKSLSEIEQVLYERGLHFGMNVNEIEYYYPNE